MRFFSAVLGRLFLSGLGALPLLLGLVLKEKESGQAVGRVVLV